MKKIVMREVGTDNYPEYYFYEHTGQRYVEHRAVWILVTDEEWAEYMKCWKRMQELQKQWENTAQRVQT